MLTGRRHYLLNVFHGVLLGSLFKNALLVRLCVEKLLKSALHTSQRGANKKQESV
jgi:hypothetical protein